MLCAVLFFKSNVLIVPLILNKVVSSNKPPCSWKSSYNFMVCPLYPWLHICRFNQLWLLDKCLVEKNPRIRWPMLFMGPLYIKSWECKNISWSPFTSATRTLPPGGNIEIFVYHSRNTQNACRPLCYYIWYHVICTILFLPCPHCMS